MDKNIDQALKELCIDNGDILGSALINLDGVVLNSILNNQNNDIDLIGGMSASMLGVGEKISTELMSSELDQIYVKSPNGYVMLNAVGKHALLMVITTKDARLGLVFLEVGRLVEKLERLYRDI